MLSNGMQYLNSRLMFGMQPGLESTKKLCNVLGNPEKSFKAIHVVGTNGKGSTAFYLAGILKAHGYKTAFYSSPHLVSMQERIRVDDEPISLEDLDRLLLKVKRAAEELSSDGVFIEPTFFEVLTLVAFLYYQEKKIDVAVLEAGMGGRLDSTAVACGNTAVLTSIGLEHTEILGSNESEILKEKMGVLGTEFSKNKTFILGGLSRDLLIEAKAYSEALGAKCIVPQIRSDIRMPNLGMHYVENASLSVKAAEIFINENPLINEKKYDDSIALELLKKRSWAGRMQLLKDDNGKVQIILDGAHNSHAVKRLVKTLQDNYPEKKFTCLFGALKDKDVEEMLKMMGPCVSKWYVTKTSYPRFRELSEMKNILQLLNFEIAGCEELSYRFLSRIRKCNDEKNEGPLLITGSLYMIGSCVELLKNDFKELCFFKNLTPSTNEHR